MALDVISEAVGNRIGYHGQRFVSGTLGRPVVAVVGLGGRCLKSLRTLIIQGMSGNSERGIMMRSLPAANTSPRVPAVGLRKRRLNDSASLAHLKDLWEPISNQIAVS